MRRDRRWFLGAGLAAGSAGALGWVLPGRGEPTAPSGELGAYGDFLVQTGQAEVSAGGELLIPAAAPPAEWKGTEENILGPYHREGAPFRAKISPPLEPGETLVVRGRVWGLDTRKPLAGAQLHIWQANAAGRYDNDDPRNPPADGLFVHRARLVTDESGYYEYETIKPGRYQIGPDAWRPAHIHYLTAARGYKTLVTQLYFKGDPMNASDRFIRPSLIMDPEKITRGEGWYWLGTFDIVLAPA